ncbi:MAG: hypothetical protein IJX90_02365 [Blautia sp.]|nr:hypothetical protein [Blautia sp.]
MKKDFRDDGRTVADMSHVEKPSYASGWISRRGVEKLAVSREERTSRSTPAESQMDSEERRASILGVLSASLLIALIFIGAAGALIALLLFLWGA